jgi:hypothetical protein
MSRHRFPPGRSVHADAIYCPAATIIGGVRPAASEGLDRSRLTNHRYDADDPDVSQPTAGGYGPGGAYQYGRLLAAIQLDRAAALQSASWGLGQIMAENHAASGFAGVEDMVAAMMASEDQQLAAMAAYLRATEMAELLQRHDWSSFARLYNGPNYAAHNYDGLLQQFHARYSAGPLPDLRVRAAQVYLQYRGFLTGVIDGIPGPAHRTRGARLPSLDRHRGDRNDR